MQNNAQSSASFGNINYGAAMSLAGHASVTFYSGATRGMSSFGIRVPVSVLSQLAQVLSPWDPPTCSEDMTGLPEKWDVS